VPCALATLSLCAASARAEPEAIPPKREAQEANFDEASARADSVEFDARQREVYLRGDVRLDASPFHLRSEGLQVKRTGYGLEVQGSSRVAFCPCPDTPLTLRVDGATVAPPGDLFLTRPTLEWAEVPIAYLPYFWLRAPSRMGVLPPIVQYRGGDGLLLGGGVHLPWHSVPVPRRPWPDPERPPDRALDLRAAGYLKGGVRIMARFATPTSSSSVAWDYLGTHGLSVDARGTGGDVGSQLAWDVDALRGERGLRSESDMTIAAKPYDRAQSAFVLRAGHTSVGTSVQAVGRRGAEAATSLLVGPTVFARHQGHAWGHVLYAAGVEAGAFALPRSGGAAQATLSFARAEAELSHVRAGGPALTTTTARGHVVGSSDGGTEGVDRFVVVGSQLGLPLGRAFGDGPVPLFHQVQPLVSFAALSAEAGTRLGPAFQRGFVPLGEAAVASIGVTQALGRWGRGTALSLDTRIGVIGRAAEGREPVARVSALAEQGLVGGAAEITAHQGNLGASLMSLGRVRLGRAWEGPQITLRSAYATGPDTVGARVLGDSLREPGGGFLSRSGLTGGASGRMPIVRRFSLFAGADGDLSERELLATFGGFELSDRCGCITLRGTAQTRYGRDGFDALLSVDLAPVGSRN
jgi:hypothetical protein